MNAKYDSVYRPTIDELWDDIIELGGHGVGPIGVICLLTQKTWKSSFLPK